MVGFLFMGTGISDTTRISRKGEFFECFLKKIRGIRIIRFIRVKYSSKFKFNIVLAGTDLMIFKFKTQQVVFYFFSNTKDTNLGGLS